MTEAESKELPDYRDRTDWEKALAERAALRGSTARQFAAEAADRLRQAVVPIEAMTGDPNWDYFLSLLQEKLEVRRERLKNMQAIELTFLSYDPNQLATQQAAKQIEYAVIRELEEIIGLPRTIKQAAENAARAAAT